MSKHKYVLDTKHPQVPFITRQGQPTLVDEGLFGILTLLRVLGVDTRYSCQGDEYGAYISADTKSFRPVILDALRFHKEGRLSDESSDFIDDFKDDHSFIFMLKGFKASRPDLVKEPQRFCYEREANTIYGDRTVVRWPKWRHSDVLCLVAEIMVERQLAAKTQV